MTKEDHLQGQINLLYNSLLNLKDGLAALGTLQQNEFLNSWSAQMEKAFDGLDALYPTDTTKEPKT
jgi:hypothetical protein